MTKAEAKGLRIKE